MPHARPGKRKKTPKRVLALPDLEHAKSAVLSSLTSRSGQRTYDHAIREFVGWYCSEPRLAFNRTVVLRYQIHLEQRHYAPGTINLRLAAVRRVATRRRTRAAEPRAGGRHSSCEGHRRLGVRMGNWLTAEQDRRLLHQHGPMTLRGTRDHAMLALLIGCGLRRGSCFA
jgi:site-specific recombinase XerD